MIKSYNDNLEKQLTPAEKHVLSYAKAHPDLPFCWKEFADKYQHGTIRNAFSKLANLRLIKPYCRTCNAYYVLYTSNQKGPHVTVTTSHMGGKYNLKRLVSNNYEKYLESLGWEEIWKVHDIVFCFKVGELYEQALKQSKFQINEQSKDILLPNIIWQNNRTLSFILHRTGTVNCYLKCSECPIEVTPEGLVELSAFLGKAHTQIEDLFNSFPSLGKRQLIPSVSNWIVTQWHYGKDGKREISGKSFNITYKTWSGTLVRIYLKRHGKSFRPRKEVIEQPRKTLPQAFFEKVIDEIVTHNKNNGGDSNC